MEDTSKKFECPKCGGTEMGKGKNSGYSVIYPEGKVFGTGSDIEYILCTSCGFVVEQYVKKPEKFKQ